MLAVHRGAPAPPLSEVRSITRWTRTQEEKCPALEEGGANQEKVPVRILISLFPSDSSS